MNWLEEILVKMTLTEEVEDYLLGRGAKEATIREEGIVTWSPPSQAVTDAVFCRRYGPYGEKIAGYLVTPVRSPKGALIGFEARSIRQKAISDFRFVEAAWNPFWLGTRRAMPKIWAGGDVWIVEGLFDLCPLEWAVPEKDAVLASVRARLSACHVEFLRRFCKGQVNMVYDQDPAGRAGMHGWTDETGKKKMGALERLRRVGLVCRDVPFQGGKDPGQIWDRGGAKAVQAAFPI